MKNKHSPYLFLFGIILLSFGSAHYYVEQRFSLIASTISLIGFISLLITLIQRGRLTNKTLANSRWNYAILKYVVVLLCIVFFVGINYFSNTLTSRWDVTKTKQHTLTTSTVEFIKGLDRDVKLTALYVGLPPKYLEDLFKEYERVSDGKVSIEIIDQIEQIGYAAQFGSLVSGDERKVIVRAGNERRDVDFTQSSLSEEKLTNAIVRVTRAPRKVYFLIGHGEYSPTDEGEQGLSSFAKKLESNNITSKTLMLGITDSIPDDGDVLVIAGPRNALTEKENTMIQAFLEKGGDALFLIENVIVTTPDKPLTDEEKQRNPSLNNILNHWGVDIQDDIVVDLSSHAGSDVGSPATRNYNNHKAITEGLDYTFYVRPRSIRVLDDLRSSIKLATIVSTASKENSWAETNRTLDINFDENVDTPGPVPFSFVIFEGKEKSEQSDTRIIVFTDADFLTNAYINQYSNAKMGLNIINWLSELDYHVFIDKKEVKVERLDLTSQQRRLIAAILFLIPLFITAGGIVVWMRE